MVTNVTLSIPTEQALLMTAKAETQGLSLEAWLLQLGAREATRKRPRYTLEELLAQCDPNAPVSEEEIEWMNMPPVGREVW